MTQSPLIKRLTQLRNLEFFNIFFLPLCLYYVLSVRQVTNWQPYAYGMFLVCFILAQGVYYWHLKLHEVKKIAELPTHFLKTFTTFKILNFLLILFFPILGILAKVISGFQFQISIWSVLIHIFAILEFINYYYYQLSHDTKNDLKYLIQHKRLRQSLLSKDILELSSPRNRFLK